MDGVAGFRKSATGFRKRRAELDHALDVGDQDLIWEEFCQGGRVKRRPQPSSWPPLR